MPLDATLLQKGEIKSEIAEAIALPPLKVLGKLWLEEPPGGGGLQSSSSSVHMRRVQLFQPLRHEIPQPQPVDCKIEWKPLDQVR